MAETGTTYRSRDEITRVREAKDPITRTKDRLVKNNWATEDELKVCEASSYSIPTASNLHSFLP